MLTKLIDHITGLALDRLTPILERKLDELKTQATEKLLALLPVIAATVAKTITDQVIAKIPDIDIPGVSDVFDLTETIRGQVNQSIPDIDIPILSDIIDLTELFKPR